jgi:hypothetical protein
MTDDDILPTPIRTKRPYVRKAIPADAPWDPMEIDEEAFAKFVQNHPIDTGLVDRVTSLEVALERLAYWAIKRKEVSATNVWAFERQEPARQAEKAARRAERAAAATKAAE